MSAVAHQRMLNAEALDGYREEAIAERANEILTEQCTVLETVYMEAVENLSTRLNAQVMSSAIRMARTLTKREEIDDMHRQLGRDVVKAIAAYMMPSADVMARREFEE